MWVQVQLDPGAPSLKSFRAAFSHRLFPFHGKMATGFLWISLATTTGENFFPIALANVCGLVLIVWFGGTC
jgi:hypothetical protein